MRFRSRAFSAILAVFVWTLPIVGFPRITRLPQLQPKGEITNGTRSLSRLPEARGFITRKVDRKIVCSAASRGEGRRLRRDETAVPLHVITVTRGRGPSAEAAGLTVVLRATNQLENYPVAKAALQPPLPGSRS